MTTLENQVSDHFLIIWEDLFGGRACLYARTALPLGALLGGHPLYERATWFPLGDLVLGHLKTGLAAFLSDLKPWT